MREDIKALICRNNHCVLATVSGSKPHCSLMSYAAGPECREIYMITFRHTTKYNNLLNNPLVSLLIDTREENIGTHRSHAKALTIDGRFRSIDDPGKKDVVRTQLMATHPHLKELATHPDAEPFAITVESVLLLEGVAEAYFEEIKQDN
jgi:nitroimidazol reductase NimA-like FMN-containing flavoprotein (pyridoxamine 5'-phosphate oxidase superfamily)